MGNHPSHHLSSCSCNKHENPLENPSQNVPPWHTYNKLDLSDKVAHDPYQIFCKCSCSDLLISNQWVRNTIDYDCTRTIFFFFIWFSTSPYLTYVSNSISLLPSIGLQLSQCTVLGAHHEFSDILLEHT